MDRFEYTRVSESIADRSPSGREQAARAVHQRWIELLNARGEEGWELVSERFIVNNEANLFTAYYEGTMKRRLQE